MNKKNMGGMIAWFVQNPIAANLLMLLVLFGGVFTSMDRPLQAFPPFPPKKVTISTAYPSSSAEVVERGVTVKIEEAVNGLTGIKEITSTSDRNGSTVVVETKQGYSLDKMMRDVKRKVDAIATLPSLAEKPVISQEEWNEHVMYVSIYGQVRHDTLRQLADKVRQKLLAQGSINKVEYIGRRVREIAIEIDEASLQAYGLTLRDVATGIAKESISDSGGELRTNMSTITLRADRQAYGEDEFRNIVILTTADGANLTLGDIATVRDTFEEDLVRTRFQGQPAITLQIVDAGGTDVTKAAIEAREVVQGLVDSGQIPQGVGIKPWYDQSQYIQDRVSLLFSNGLSGILFIVAILALFLNLRLALWVSLGIPISIAGTLIMMGDSFLNYTINEMTTFGFIVVLGILVDDAVVIGENIFTTRKREGDTTAATIAGVSEVATPATFGVLTTVAAFMPLAFIKGEFGQIFGQFAVVVVVALCFSLLESKFILPAHLNHVNVNSTAKPNVLVRPLAKLQGWVAHGLDLFNERIYVPFMQRVLNMPGVALAVFLGLLICVFALVGSGRVRSVFFPNIPGTLLTASITMDQEAGEALAMSNALHIESELVRLNEEWKEKYGMESAPVTDIQTNLSSATSFTVTGKLDLEPESEITAVDMIKEWSTAVGPLEGVDVFNYNSTGWDMEDISINISGREQATLQAAATRLKERLRQYSGVNNVRDDNKPNQPQIRFTLKPEARNLGVTLDDLTSQLRGGFQGYEAQRFQQGRDEVKVQVRYPADQRRYIEDLKRTRIRTAAGALVPLSVVAELEPGYAAVEIHRRDGNRVTTVVADTDKTVTSPSQVLADLQEKLFPQLRREFPDIGFAFSGEVQEESEASSSLWGAFVLTMGVIYALLAVPLKSYTKPLFIMAAIPFGFIGAVGGHWLLGYPLSLLSFFGLLALCGVVVNDSLLLVTEYGAQRERGLGVNEALLAAGVRRMRSIFLTSITTFLGLVPLLAESSEQAQYLKPAAVSMAYGILFATVITLILIPALIRFSANVKRTVIGKREDRTPAATVPVMNEN
ncbi:efflux RND transporter permease subunit [Pseudodesulfovibrio indicus]|uniref:Multidrug efflux pump subunit AcrB n=2 Tax=Pseudodesulfovibrio indicus TaxID=1716143 RepID=A0AA94PM34_9BACT|nr:efflux RND transporter permease subunit [Pseudodesulfovibrio indicus]TDT87869.1 multidrug efflux pump subunit AcrB [Pseudodesulfovibrio indicus]